MGRRDDRPDCLHCIHYFVTWQADQPRGCRAYEFRSARLPSDVVLESSGETCRFFQRKPAARERSRLLR
ncbi:MAG TPA: uracil-DNA glycosylase [Deltaproteobacteria bacterium]|nr:uracil-DNA glycosylase [Deltaproteobacteria bacterium]